MNLKRLLTAMGVGLAMVAFAAVGFAGDYHFGVGLICSGLPCHALQPVARLQPERHGQLWSHCADGPYHYLLRNDINDLCLGCHDGQAFAPDVFEAHSNGYVRQAGALNEVGGNGLYPPPTGHTLGSTDDRSRRHLRQPGWPELRQLPLRSRSDAAARPEPCGPGRLPEPVRGWRDVHQHQLHPR